MNFKHLWVFLILLSFLNCKQGKDVYLNKIEGKRIHITDSMQADQAILDYIKPYHDHLNNDLDSILAIAVDTYSPRPENEELETALGNFMADVAYEQANLVFNKRTGRNIDMVLINHGGIRATLSKGNVSARTAYNIMPFDNALVVVDLKGEQIEELIAYLARSKRAHPISKLNLKLDENNAVLASSINGVPIDFNKNYLVATYDYLYNGGNRMNFFQTNDSLYVLDYKMRNAMIDYFKKVDTINPIKDGRFIKTSSK